MANLPPAFDLLFSVPDLPLLLFSSFDPSTLALAACVCVKWRDLARRVRDDEVKVEEGAPSNNTVTLALRFQLSFKALVHTPTTLAWAVENLNEKQLPQELRAKACTIATQEGALGTLKWLRTNGYAWDGKEYLAAVRGGNLEILKWLRANSCPWNPTLVYHIAAQSSRFDIMDWALAVGGKFDPRVSLRAAQDGKLEVLQWVQANGCPWDRGACMEFATRLKRANVVAWIANQQS